jgi:tRNA threonylcarbamoyladenosine biosynthesis protein TsaE
VKVITKSPAETKRLAIKLAGKIKSGRVVALVGDLGAGKTTFVQGLARALGIKQRIISPTFIIARRYNFKNNYFYHVDLYRTKDADEISGLGLEEMWENKKNIVVIEWPEEILSKLPAPIIIKINNLGGNKREYDFGY